MAVEVPEIGLQRVHTFRLSLESKYVANSESMKIVICPLMNVQGVKAVIAKSFERIHRSNLVGMGVIPLCFKAGEDADTLGLTGYEKYDINLPDEIVPGMDVKVTTDNGKEFLTTLRFDTQVNQSLETKSHIF